MKKKLRAKHANNRATNEEYWREIGRPLGWKPSSWNDKDLCYFDTLDGKTVEVNAFHVRLIACHTWEVLDKLQLNNSLLIHGMQQEILKVCD